MEGVLSVCKTFEDFAPKFCHPSRCFAHLFSVKRFNDCDENALMHLGQRQPMC